MLVDLRHGSFRDLIPFGNQAHEPEVQASSSVSLNLRLLPTFTWGILPEAQALKMNDGLTPRWAAACWVVTQGSSWLAVTMLVATPDLIRSVWINLTGYPGRCYASTE